MGLMFLNTGFLGKRDGLVVKSMDCFCGVHVPNTYVGWLTTASEGTCTNLHISPTPTY